MCVRPIQRVINRVGRDLIDNIYDGSFCVGGGENMPLYPETTDTRNPARLAGAEEYCFCGFDFNNVLIREEWIKRFHDGWGGYQGRSTTDSRGTISWLSLSPPSPTGAVGMGSDGLRPFLTTDTPVLSEQLPRAQALVEKLKQDTAGNCYLQHVHDQGHLDARHVHIQCNRDRVSTPDRDIPSGTLLDMVADTVSRMIEP